jgi:hypothetical protein
MPEFQYLSSFYLSFFPFGAFVTQICDAVTLDADIASLASV